MELFRHLKIRNWTGNIINNVKQKNFKYLKSNPKTKYQQGNKQTMQSKAKENQTSNIFRHMQLFENEKATGIFDENWSNNVLLRMTHNKTKFKQF